MNLIARIAFHLYKNGQIKFTSHIGRSDFRLQGNTADNRWPDKNDYRCKDHIHCGWASQEVDLVVTSLLPSMQLQPERPEDGKNGKRIRIRHAKEGGR